MTRRVLMVDDEEDLVWSLARQMRRERPELEFEGLTDPEQALARVAERAPDVLVTDVRMPGMNGLELLLAARRLAPDLPVIVMTAYGNAEVRSSVLRTPSVQYLEKPFPFTALLAAVEQALARPTGFSGAISLPMLPDLIQLYALAHMSGALHITRGGARGTVWFEHGDIVHAECDGIHGTAAVFGLLRWEGGTFLVDATAQAPVRSIDASWQELLVEGCRQIDEDQRGPEPAAEAAARSPSAGAADALVAPLWGALGPLVAASAPEALVLAVRLADGAGVVLQGAADPELWSRALTELIETAERIVPPGQRGAVECVGRDSAVAASWDRGAGLALVIGGALSGTNAASRFRSNVARWHEACGTWLGTR